ncbi:E3 ubiquitin-protein ligase RAD18 [Onychostruthus taczanowskii]|uniref:E3 ubiquitin-protein ligase RAD18 n=1 Tax=Onychostruthus taczanowskii TaxID=356909 RepID=UPI001B80589E|nr:E3 ubiquitin-protein ligase RAD18 [Onychostruthus taczanowskii]
MGSASGEVGAGWAPGCPGHHPLLITESSWQQHGPVLTRPGVQGVRQVCVVCAVYARCAPARPEAAGRARAGPAAGARRWRWRCSSRRGRPASAGTAPAALTPLSLQAVDDLLRCGICFDYFSIAVIIPQCSHSYCSLCIRKSLSYKTQCPTCCVAVSESDLKNNRILDDLVKSFNSARQQLLQLVLEAPPVPSPPAHSQRPAESHCSPVSLPESKEVPGTDSSLRKDKVCPSTRAGGLAWTGQKSFKTEERHDLHGTSAEAGGQHSQGRSQEIPGSTQSHEKPSTSVLKGDRKVECPVCEVAILEQYINKHLDSCLTRGEKKDSLRSSDHKRKLMSKVVYNLLSDRDLRKKLKEHGLSTSGTRQQLIKRHQEFVHMYNAQCDSLNPKSVAEVVKELEKNEKIRVQLECNKPGENSLTFTKDQTEEEIDEIHAEYRNKHRSEFKFLVDQVNKRWKKMGERKAESAQNKEEVAVKGLPAATEPGEEAPTAVVPGEAQALQSEIPDGQSSESPGLRGWQRSASPEFSLSSGSTCSTSSDILTDMERSEMCSPSSDSSSSVVALTGNKRKLRRIPGDSGTMPQGKRKRS